MSAVIHPDLVVKLPAWRARLMLGLLLVSLAVLAGRAFYLQSLHHGFLQQKGESRYSRVIEISATRGKITDRKPAPIKREFLKVAHKVTAAEMEEEGKALEQEAREAKSKAKARAEAEEE